MHSTAMMAKLWTVQVASVRVIFRVTPPYFTEHIMLRTRFFVAIATLVASSYANQAKAVPIAYAISGSGASLIAFDISNPSGASVVGSFSGALTSLAGLDFRPANGLLYGYSQGSNALVTINPLNAVTTFVSTPSTGSTTSVLGVDFNPVPDRLRLVNMNDQNLRINVDTGATIVDGTLAYGAGDPNFGTNPSIIEAAYTNSDTNLATGTTLYYIDNILDTLVTTTNPNGGALTTVGSLGLNTSDLVGFDILSDGFGGNTAYALLSPFNASQTSLYSVNLATGAATLVGGIGQFAYGLAIVQPTVPEPSSALIAVGLSLVGLRLRSRRVS